jgi:RNA polymerase sigma-70 factor (ECF subfamily)
MDQTPNPDLTALLQAWSAGDAEARDKVWHVVFVELERLASAYIRQERPGHTLEPHALINELYVRLDAWNSAQWINRSHFFGMCARMMRQILVDYARTRTRQRRGGDVERIVLDDAIVFSESKCEQLIALDEAMKRLASEYPRQAQVVELRYFGGLSEEEAAGILDVSRPTVTRDWNFARAWLMSELRHKSDET